jgi:hypothetical protein
VPAKPTQKYRKVFGKVPPDPLQSVQPDFSLRSVEKKTIEKQEDSLISRKESSQPSTVVESNQRGYTETNGTCTKTRKRRIPP